MRCGLLTESLNLYGNVLMISFNHFRSKYHFKIKTCRDNARSDDTICLPVSRVPSKVAKKLQHGNSSGTSEEYNRS